MRSSLILATLLVSLPALAQVEPPDAPKLPDNDGVPLVYYVHSYITGRPNRAGLDDHLSVHVQNFKRLLETAGGNCSGLVLFINGMAIKGLQPQSCDRETGHVRYLLARTPQSSEAWVSLLGGPGGYTRPVSISIGAGDQFSIASTVSGFELEVIPRSSLFLFLGITFVGLLIFQWLCRFTGLIRSGPAGDDATKLPYSLSLFQMAFWFFLVITAYVFIWMINDELDTITDSVLALLGMGAGTALGSSLIDKNKQAAAGGAPGAVAVVAGKPRASRGFLRDILSDDGKISLHRVQLFVWTLILGVIFCGSVYRNLAMPSFSAMLLGLMGISSGTYLGFKLPEGQKTDPEPAPSPGADGGT